VIEYINFTHAASVIWVM